LANTNIVETSKKQNKLGAINNITTKENSIDGCEIIKEDLINQEKPLYHNYKKLALTIINIYKNKLKKSYLD